MILRFLNGQGIAGLAASLALAVLLLVQKGDTRHWRKQSSQFEQLYRAEQTAFAGTVPTITPAPRRRAPRTRPMPPASPPNKKPSRKGPHMTTKLAWPTLALALSGCGKAPSPRPIPAVAETRQCPAYPLPPVALLKPPVKIDFLTSPSPQPSKRFSSTN